MAAKSKPKTPRTNSRKSRSSEFDQAQFVLNTYRNAQEMSRALLHSRLGTQFGGKRDLYKTFGYPLDPDYHDYRNLYDRHGLAARVIDKFAESTWGKPPVLIDGDGRSDDLGQQATPFLVEWDKLVKRLQVWQIFQQADIMCGIGKYSIIFLGAPGDSYAQPAPDNGLFYLMSYDESQAGITQFIQDTNNEKFGMPAEYTVQFNSVDQGVQFTGGSAVHYSRVIHVSEHRLGSRIYGRPRLQTVLNRLFDLEKVTGGGAEAAWLAVYKGILLLPKEGFSTPEKDSPVMKNLDEQMTKLMNQIQRYAVIDGADVHDLGVEEVRIRDIYDTLKTDFAGSIGIPQRILFGAERGELASTQDQQEWNATIKSRQTNFAQPEILEPFIQWCIQHKIIPPPMSGKYDIEWPPVYTMNETERANYALVVAQGANTITGGVPEEAIDIDEWRGELGLPPKPNPLDVLPKPQTIPAKVPPPMVPGTKIPMATIPDLSKIGGNGNGGNGFHKNDFEDHEGRPGKVGGSLPKDAGGGGGVAAIKGSYDVKDYTGGKVPPKVVDDIKVSWEGDRRDVAVGTIISRSKNDVSVLKDNGEIVGVLGMRPSRLVFIPEGVPKGDYAYIDGVATKRSGYGKDMMNLAVSKARDNNQGLLLTANISEREGSKAAIGFYKSLGMHQSKEDERIFYWSPKEIQDLEL